MMVFPSFFEDLKIIFCSMISTACGLLHNLHICFERPRETNPMFKESLGLGNLVRKS